MAALSRWRRGARWASAEPLLHFLLLGALIFYADGVVHPNRGNDAHRIEVKAADLDRLRALALQQWGQEPDAQQMRDLVQGFIREEVLVREALATGMDQGDIIVRRRLAQKMEFLGHEGVKNPSEEQQRAYLASHAEQFLQDSGTDLEQLYFNTAQRGSKAQMDAAHARDQLLQKQPVVGDVCMLGRNLQHQTAADLERDFGAGFAKAVAQLTPGSWSAPLPSALGWHLVRVVHASQRRLPAFEAVQSQVLAQMVNAQVAQARDAAYARLLAGYTVQQP